MSDNHSWQPWMPDDLTPPPIAVAPAPFESEELILPGHTPSPEDDHGHALMALKTQAHEQGFAAGFSEGRQQGITEGHQQGYQQGLEQGLEEGRQQQIPICARMQQLLSEFQHTLDALDSVIASRLVQMALEAARQVIGQAPTGDNQALIKHIQQLLQQEPLFSGKPVLRVHPQDLGKIEEMVGASLQLHGWRLRADPTLHPGGCKLSAEEGDLDASVATRWQELCRLAAPDVL